MHMTSTLEMHCVLEEGWIIYSGFYRTDCITLKVLRELESSCTSS